MATNEEIKAAQDQTREFSQQAQNVAGAMEQILSSSIGGFDKIESSISMAVRTIKDLNIESGQSSVFFQELYNSISKSDLIMTKYGGTAEEVTGKLAKLVGVDFTAMKEKNNTMADDSVKGYYRIISAAEEYYKQTTGYLDKKYAAEATLAQANDKLGTSTWNIRMKQAEEEEQKYIKAYVLKQALSTGGVMSKADIQKATGEAEGEFGKTKAGKRADVLEGQEGMYKLLGDKGGMAGTAAAEGINALSGSFSSLIPTLTTFLASASLWMNLIKVIDGFREAGASAAYTHSLITGEATKSGNAISNYFGSMAEGAKLTNIMMAAVGGFENSFNAAFVAGSLGPKIVSQWTDAFKQITLGTQEESLKITTQMYALGSAFQFSGESGVKFMTTAFENFRGEAFTASQELGKTNLTLKDTPTLYQTVFEAGSKAGTGFKTLNDSITQNQQALSYANVDLGKFSGLFANLGDNMLKSGASVLEFKGVFDSLMKSMISVDLPTMLGQYMAVNPAVGVEQAFKNLSADVKSGDLLETRLKTMRDMVTQYGLMTGGGQELDLRSAMFVGQQFGISPMLMMQNTQTMKDLFVNGTISATALDKLKSDSKDYQNEGLKIAMDQKTSLELIADLIRGGFTALISLIGKMSGNSEAQTMAQQARIGSIESASVSSDLIKQGWGIPGQKTGLK